MQAIPAPAPPQVHVVNVQAGKPAAPELVEINSSSAPSSYTNGKLNPDRAQPEQQQPPQAAAEPPKAEPGPEAGQGGQPAAEMPAERPAQPGRPAFARKTSLDGRSDKLIQLLDETELRVERLR